MEGESVKMAMIAAASSALEFKARNPKATDEEALQHVTRESDKILRKIDEDGL